MRGSTDGAGEGYETGAPPRSHEWPPSPDSEVIRVARIRLLDNLAGGEVRRISGAVGDLAERLDEHLRSYRDCLASGRNDAIVRLAAPFEGRILDVGCGFGQVLLKAGWLGHPAQMVGVDLDVELLRFGALLKKLGKSRPRSPDLVAANALRLPFADKTFDLVICRVVLMSLPVRAALRELTRVLADGGRVYLHLTGMGFYLDDLASRRWKGALLAFVNGLLLSLSGKQICVRGLWNNYQPLKRVKRILEDEGCRLLTVEQGPRRALLTNNIKVLASKGF